MLSIIDLFAGAGGISLGAARAGFRLAGAVELDDFAIDTHGRNFPQSAHLQLDVGKLSGAELLSQVGLAHGELSGLVGGPPCQGFSAIGKRDITDPRNNLFHHFFRLVKETRPSFFLAENVPGILDDKYSKIRNDAFAQLNKTEYVILPPIHVRASDFGAPTTRTRIFFFGYNQKHFRGDFGASDFIASENLLPTFVGHALHGLPVEIDSDWQTAESGWRPLEGFSQGYYFDRILNNVPKNIGDPLSLDRFFSTSTVSGCMGTRHTAEVIERFARLKWGETDKISRAIRLSPDGFCPTLRAGTASDRGSFQAVRPIHHLTARVITPREAARLQGFPDWFVFQPTKWHSFRQIGNSVSPLVSEFILRAIHSKIS